MDPITTAILARGIYDLLQSSLSYTKDTLKEKLREFIVDEKKADEAAEKIEELNLNEDMSQKAIEKKINSDPELLDILKSIAKENNVNVNQYHFGTGDNVARDKIVKE
ncbi:hypothetical protein [Pantoea sp. SO10]|uniref:GapS6a family protein n=1 Tax=Pantoea sp. SO10 TaxID=2575375 RepID=UPI0010C9B769|nr:hypothetical protein [Pantoea sp. SO10]QCP62355.1 hypothetical protein FCN45_23385 [Pantoea sp. SO10]